MAIVSGYQKMKDYIKQSSGYKLLSRWANANTVECDDAQTVQSKIGGITGISSSLTANSSTQAASTQLTNQLYQNMNQLSSEFQAWFGVTEDGQRGWKEQGADTVTPFNMATKVLAMFHASSSGITRYTADRRIVGLTMVVEDARKSYTVLKVNGINQPEKDIVTISSSIAFGYQTYDIILNHGDEVAVTNRGGGGGDVVLLSGIVQAADQ